MVLIATATSSYFLGIQTVKHYPKSMQFSELASLPLSFGFVILLFYVSQENDLFSDNNTHEIIKKYIELKTYNSVSKELNIHPEQVKRTILDFIERNL